MIKGERDKLKAGGRFGTGVRLERFRRSGRSAGSVGNSGSGSGSIQVSGSWNEGAGSTGSGSGCATGFRGM